MKETYNIEQQVADVILSRPVTVEIRGKEYKVDRLTNRMLISVSALIAKHIPEVNKDEDTLQEVLRIAKDTKGLATVVSSLIVKPGIFSTFRRKIVERAILNSEPTDTYNIVVRMLNTSNISSFFALIVFLNEVNNLKPTTGGTIASGMSLEDLQEHTE